MKKTLRSMLALTSASLLLSGMLLPTVVTYAQEGLSGVADSIFAHLSWEELLLELDKVQDSEENLVEDFKSRYVALEVEEDEEALEALREELIQKLEELQGEPLPTPQEGLYQIIYRDYFTGEVVEVVPSEEQDSEIAYDEANSYASYKGWGVVWWTSWFTDGETGVHEAIVYIIQGESPQEVTIVIRNEDQESDVWIDKLYFRSEEEYEEYKETLIERYQEEGYLYLGRENPAMVDNIVFNRIDLIFSSSEANLEEREQLITRLEELLVEFEGIDDVGMAGQLQQTLDHSTFDTIGMKWMIKTAEAALEEYKKNNPDSKVEIPKDLEGMLDIVAGDFAFAEPNDALLKGLYDLKNSADYQGLTLKYDFESGSYAYELHEEPTFLLDNGTGDFVEIDPQFEFPYSSREAAERGAKYAILLRDGKDLNAYEIEELFDGFVFKLKLEERPKPGQGGNKTDTNKKDNEMTAGEELWHQLEYGVIVDEDGHTLGEPGHIEVGEELWHELEYGVIVDEDGHTLGEPGDVAVGEELWHELKDGVLGEDTDEESDKEVVKVEQEGAKQEARKQEELPATGENAHVGLLATAFLAVISGLSLLAPKFRKN